jgi:hypothetical protein
MTRLKRSSGVTAVKYILIISIMAMLWATCIAIAADQNESNTSVSAQTSSLPVFINISGPQR